MGLMMSFLGGREREKSEVHLPPDGKSNRVKGPMLPA